MNIFSYTSIHPVSQIAAAIWRAVKYLCNDVAILCFRVKCIKTSQKSFKQLMNLWRSFTKRKADPATKLPFCFIHASFDDRGSPVWSRKPSERQRAVNSLNWIQLNCVCPTFVLQMSYRVVMLRHMCTLWSRCVSARCPGENIAILLLPSDHYVMGEALPEHRWCTQDVQDSEGKSLEIVLNGVE